jgi:hypothetical protein
MALTDDEGNELSALKGNDKPPLPKMHGQPGQAGGPPLADVRQVATWDGKKTVPIAHGLPSQRVDDYPVSEPSAFRRVFEYDIIPWKDEGGLSGMIAFLNEKGADGWEAFYVVTGQNPKDGMRHFIHFKRELA